MMAAEDQDPKRIAYLLDRPEMCGGVKVVLQHAQMLGEAGYDVSVLGKGARPRWYRGPVDYQDYTIDTDQIPPADLLIGTYWTTLAAAPNIGHRRMVHFCQGYEAHYPHLTEHFREIRRVYDLSYPSLVISPHLGEFLHREHGKSWVGVQPPISIKPPSRSEPRAHPRIIIHGIYECCWKGVKTALEIAGNLRAEGLKIEVTRVSLLDITDEEESALPRRPVRCCTTTQSGRRSHGRF